MKHTDWINQCCDSLMKSPEFPSDTLLKTYIDVRVLAQKSAEVFNGNVHRHRDSPLHGERILEAGIQRLDHKFCLFQEIEYEARQHGSGTCELPLHNPFVPETSCCQLPILGHQKTHIYL
ncbi:hypothetical protein BDV36DRAFT_244355, partial [Aspergillus pseudocaelatus]